MPSTYLSLHYHIVFSTKERREWLDPAWREDLFEYMGGTIRGMGGFPQGVGGVADHVHLLIGLKATHCLADVVRDLKKAASAWVHEKGNPLFAWQEGYAAFTVSATARGAVKRYIAKQEEHHQTASYLDELREMLERAGVDYDPKYLE